MSPLAHINAELAPTTVALDTLTLDPDNARVHKPESINAIAASLSRFGQQKPIVVTAEGGVVAGNGTVLAARQLGWSEISAVVFSGTTEAKRAYAIADNRLAELSSWNDQALVDAIQALERDDPTLLVATGFTVADVAEIQIHADAAVVSARLEEEAMAVLPPIRLSFTLVCYRQEDYQLIQTFLAALANVFPEQSKDGDRLVEFLRSRRGTLGSPGPLA